jgi:rhodanese-related sulfurtransferase
MPIQALVELHCLVSGIANMMKDYLMKDALIKLLTLSSVGFGMAAIGAEHTKDSMEKVRELIAADKAILVDVREKVEWDAGHIEGAKWVPMSKLTGELTSEEIKKLLPPDKIVYLYCAGGYRCLDVAEMFEDQKLQLRALKQGYQTLLKEGFPNAKLATDAAKISKP